jgi:hypothetical protein
MMVSFLELHLVTCTSKATGGVDADSDGVRLALALVTERDEFDLGYGVRFATIALVNGRDLFSDLKYPGPH